MKNFTQLFNCNKIKHTKYSQKFILAFYIISIFLQISILSESVCDHELLIMELKQDLEDNGILDCLRYFQFFK